MAELLAAARAYQSEQHHSRSEAQSAMAAAEQLTTQHQSKLAELKVRGEGSGDLRCSVLLLSPWSFPFHASYLCCVLLPFTGRLADASAHWSHAGRPAAAGGPQGALRGDGALTQGGQCAKH